MNLDRDLRDALQPLGGDPVADAARVLEVLPPMLPALPPTPPKWLPWLMLMGGLVVGAAGGLWLGSSPTAPVVTPPTQPENQGPKKTDVNPDQPLMPDMMSAAERADHLLLMAFGEIDVDEPKEGHQKLKPGEWYVRVGTTFQTGGGQVGAYAFANDASVRLDRQTEATLLPNDVTLEKGRMWVCCGNRDETVRVALGGSGKGTSAMVEAGKAMFTRSTTGLDVLALQGTTIVRTERGETIKLAKGERVLIDPGRGSQPKQAMPFTGTATTWMTVMIENSRDPEELKQRITEMVDAFASEEHRDEARIEILKLGSLCVYPLVDSVWKHLVADRDYALETARLIALIVTFPTSVYALGLLEAEDRELREIVFYGVKERTQTDAGTDAEFWRNATLANRQVAIQRWTKQLGR